MEKSIDDLLLCLQNKDLEKAAAIKLEIEKQYPKEEFKEEYEKSHEIFDLFQFEMDRKEICDTVDKVIAFKNCN